MNAQKRSLRPSLCFIVFSCIALLASCGGRDPSKRIVKDIYAKASLEGENQDIWLSVSTTFDFGKMGMTAIQIPIVEPLRPEIEYGKIEFLPTLDGYNQIKIGINLTQAAGVPGGYASLPNGDDLPIGGLDDVEVIELAIKDINSKIYIALDRNATLFGFAISIKEFASSFLAFVSL